MEQVSISVLAVAITVFAAPLFVDLALCVAGNFFRARRPIAAVRLEIRLAVGGARQGPGFGGGCFSLGVHLLGAGRGWGE